MDFPIQWQDDWAPKILAFSALVAAVSVIIYKTPVHNVGKWIWRAVKWVWKKLVAEPIGKWTKDVIGQVVDEKITQPNGGSALVDKLIGLDERHNDLYAQLQNIHNCLDRRFADSHAAIDKIAAMVQRVLTESVGTRERIWQLYRSLELPIFEADAVGQFTYVNPAFTKLTGLAPTQASGEGWAIAIHPEDRDRVFRVWNQAVLSGGEFSVIFRFRNRINGEISEVHCSATALRDGRGLVVGWVGTTEPTGASPSATVDDVGSTSTF